MKFIKEFGFGLVWLLFMLIILFLALAIVAHYGPGPLGSIARKAGRLAQPHS